MYTRICTNLKQQEWETKWPKGLCAPESWWTIAWPPSATSADDDDDEEEDEDEDEDEEEEEEPLAKDTLMPMPV